MSDAPDWQEIVSIKPSGGVLDAPDWQRIRTGPNGTSPVTASGASPYSVYASQGFIGLTMDPYCHTQFFAQTAGKVCFYAFTAMATAKIGHIMVQVGTAATPTAHENFIMLFDWGETTAGTYTLLGQTAVGAIDAGLAAGGEVIGALSTSVSVTAGKVYAVGVLINGSVASLASINYVGNTSPNPLGLTAPVYVASTASTFVSPPGSLAFSSTATIASAIYSICYA